MKRLCSVVIGAYALLLIGACVPAYAQGDGSSCSSTIPMEKDPDHEFTYTIKDASPSSPKEVWFSAMTFDLPLSVYFAPDDGASAPAPEVEMDFSCTPGYYENDILCSLFCKTGGNSGIDFQLPHSPKLDSKTLDDGTFVYYLSLGKRYRDLLLQMGISENLKVVVHVVFTSSGVLKLAPDDFFSNCMDGSKFMQIGDTVLVKAKDSNRHVIVPYVQWQEDTIRYAWTGDEPCLLMVAADCEIDPTKGNTQDGLVQYNYIQPGQSLKVKATDIYSWVHNKDFPPQAGMYFAKFYSEADGEIKITKAPVAPPREGATIMRYGTTYALNANEQGLYAMPSSWNTDEMDVRFTTPTLHVFRMIIATDPDFSTEHVVKEFQFDETPTGHWQGILGASMVNIWSHATEQYLYVKFICSEATTITPEEWTVSDCVKSTKTVAITSLNTTFEVKRNTDLRHRFNYSQMVGGDITMSITSNISSPTCNVFVATDCDISTDATATNILTNGTITKTETYTIPASTIAGWEKRVDTEGYIYMRFHCSQNGKHNITIESSAPEETDPVYPTMTISISCDENKKPFVEVSKAQTIVIKDESGSIVKTIEDLQPETKFSLSGLSAGKYTLAGETDEIVVNL